MKFWKISKKKEKRKKEERKKNRINLFNII